jgi:hypothetical protein
MTEAVASMPKILQEIKRTEDFLREVEAEMALLSGQLKEFDEKHVAGSEELSRLDTLKNNMESCRSILMEHNRWNTLVGEARSFLESGGKLADSADRYVTLIVLNTCYLRLQDRNLAQIFGDSSRSTWT